MRDIQFDIDSLTAAYAAGYSPVDMIELALSRLTEAQDPGIFIFLARKSDLLASARALGRYDPSRPLWGIPFAVKDNIDVAGLPTTAACAEFRYIPDKDATVVARLKAAGAIVIGKTNLDQFATGLVGVRTPYPVPRNAIDDRLVPGGSSSGSAVATARGIVSFALGTDTAGSGRIPAGLNNIVGLKPSLGALSTTGVVPACRTLDCVSIFGLTVDDAWKVYGVAAAHDPSDPYSRSVPATGFGTPTTGLRVGVPARNERQFFGDMHMQIAFDTALAEVKRLGCEIVEVPFDGFHRVASLLYEGGWVAERYAAIRDFFDAKADKLYPVTRKIFEGAKALTAADAFSGFYALQALKAELEPILASVDLLCVPTAPTHYTLDQLKAEPILYNSRLGTYTNFVNLLGMCGIAVPTGKRADGWPASATLLARAGQDGLVATVARGVHAMTGLTMGGTEWRLPPLAALPPPADYEPRIDVVVVGAHLSGMPLNVQLQQLGGRLSRAVATTPSYKLYALANQNPPKPGLLRAMDGVGTAIDTEVWSLTLDAFGRFVAAIPAPLGIGTITLADGTSAKGFLAEPAGLVGATDISHHGGWRAFIAHREREARFEVETAARTLRAQR